MAEPEGFTWIEKPLLAALPRPSTPEELAWLRSEGIELLVTLTEDRLRRDWINDAGLLSFHEPMEDMEAPSQEQLDRCVSAISRAIDRRMGVAVHCAAGLGRTGSVLACYLVARGLSAQNAIARVRRHRPGSIETGEQADAVVEFARRHGQRAEW